MKRNDIFRPKNIKKKLCMMLVGVIFLMGCSNNNSANETTSTETQAPTQKVTTKDVKVSTSNLVLPLTTNDSGKVMIQTVSNNKSYRYNSYVITSSKGELVVVDPSQMPAKSIVDLKPAAILSTHSHEDHIDSTFYNSYDCKKVKYTLDDFNTKDFHIYTINSSHDSDTISTANVIIVLEVDGIRIAHMGDIGQTTLTEDQLKALGKIDIAFMQFENSYSNMDLKNKKGFNLIEQLNPKIIIPTHYDNDALPVLSEKYGNIQEYDNILTISKGDLPEKNMTVYRILNNHIYK